MKRSSTVFSPPTLAVSFVRRPLQEFLRAKQAGKPYDQAAYQKCLADSVAEVVHKQAETGIDVISDGEFGKSISWSQYVLERLSGFERRPIKLRRSNPFTRGVDREALCRVLCRTRCARRHGDDGRGGLRRADQPTPGQAELKRDIENFKAALKNVEG